MSFYLGWKCGKPAHNEKKKRSVSTQSQKIDRQNVLTFGKYHGRTYEDMFRKEFGYCQWAMTQSNPSPTLRHFAAWARQRLSHQTHEAANSEESDDDYSPEEDFDGLCSKSSTSKSNQYNKRGPVC